MALQGLSGGQVFGIVDTRNPPAWSGLVICLQASIRSLRGHRGDWPRTPRARLTDNQRAGLNRLHAELVDAKNRLRTAERAMREATPAPRPEPTRERCKHCGTPRDVATDFGEHPQYWVVSEASCRECLRRPARLAKGRRAS